MTGMQGSSSSLGIRILAVDTSTSSWSLAVTEGQRVLAEWTVLSGLAHNRRLLSNIDALLRKVGWILDELDGLAVTVGPGSFTGLRIGLTTVKTLAWSLNKLYVGVPSLDVLAAPLSHTALPICTLLDARKKEVYCAFYSSTGNGHVLRDGPPGVMPPAELPGRIKQPTLFCGDGWLLYQDFLREKLGTLAIGASAPYHLIRASFVGELARMKFEAGEGDDPMAGIPLYVRPSEAELKKPHLA